MKTFKYFGKYPLFFVLMILLVIVFIGGTAYDIWLGMQSGEAAKNLNRSMKIYRSALSEDPTDKAIKASEENIAKLNERLEFLERDLTRAGADIFKPLTATEGYQLVEQLRGMVNTWRREATKDGIVVPEDMDFGFKKYVAANAQAPAKSALAPIWKQACVLNYINGKLFACKSKESPMSIISVQRELLPEESASDSSQTAKKRRPLRLARTRRDDTKGDNFKIDEAITARKKGSLDTLAYRFIFTGHTDILRRFLNQLKDFDAMLVVRSIGVRPAEITTQAIDAGMENAPAGGFGAIFGNAPAPAEAPVNPDGTPAIPTATGDEQAQGVPPDQQSPAPVDPAVDSAMQGEVIANSRTPVVTDNISEFTVVIEYVEVVKNANPVAESGADQSKK